MAGARLVPRRGARGDPARTARPRRHPAAADRRRAAADRRAGALSRADEAGRRRARLGDARDAPQGRRGDPGRDRRLRARPDERRLRDADRDRPDPRLPPGAAPGRRHRRLPRRDPAVGRRDRAPLLRQRRPAADGDDPDRLAARRLGRHASHDAAARARPAPRARCRAALRGPRAADQGRRAHPRRRDRRRAADARRVRLLRPPGQARKNCRLSQGPTRDRHNATCAFAPARARGRGHPRHA